jgi:hypothetical protein
MPWKSKGKNVYKVTPSGLVRVAVAKSVPNAKAMVRLLYMKYSKEVMKKN